MLISGSPYRETEQLSRLTSPSGILASKLDSGGGGEDIDYPWALLESLLRAVCQLVLVVSFKSVQFLSWAIFRHFSNPKKVF